MPRYRKLHTKTLESLDVNDMPGDFCRLFWVLLPLVLCREGRGLNSATWLKSKLFPLRDDVTVKQVQGALDWCIERGMIVPYSVENRAYFFVPSFHKYQGNTAKESQSDYPPPQPQVESKSGPTPELVQSKSGTDAIFNIQYSDANGNGEAKAKAISEPVESDAVAECLRAVLDLGIREPKASQLVRQANANGTLGLLVGDLSCWIGHYRATDGVANPEGLAITQVEAGIPPPILKAEPAMRF